MASLQLGDCIRVGALRGRKQWEHFPGRKVPADIWEPRAGLYDLHKVRCFPPRLAHCHWILSSLFSAHCALTRLVCWFRSYLDVLKVFVFNFMYWITLAVVFVAGTSRISCKYQKTINQSINRRKYQSINRNISRSINQSIDGNIDQSTEISVDQSINQSFVGYFQCCCFFYLIACFFFLWHGNEFFRKPIKLLQRQWESFTLWIFLLKMEFCWRKKVLTNFFSFS